MTGNAAKARPAKIAQAYRSPSRLSLPRRLSPRSIAAISTTGLVALLVILPVSIPEGRGASPSGVLSPSGFSLTWGPPFSGHWISVNNMSSLTGCGTKALAAIPISFDATNGHFQAKSSTSAGLSSHCPRHRWVSSDEYDSFGMALNFTSTSSGSYVVRSNWNLSWNYSFLEASSSTGSYQVWFGASLYDRTTLVSWGTNGGYLNSSQPPALGGWSNHTGRWSFSLPFYAILSKGDAYTLSVYLLIDVHSTAYSTIPLAPTYSEFTLGGAAGTARLVSITIR